MCLRNRKATVAKYHERGRHAGMRLRRDPRARSHEEMQARLKLWLPSMFEGKTLAGF